MQRTAWVHRGRVFTLAGAAFEHARDLKRHRAAARTLLRFSKGKSPRRR